MPALISVRLLFREGEGKGENEGEKKIGTQEKFNFQKLQDQLLFAFFNLFPQQIL